MIEYPLLKYAARVVPQSNGLEIHYRQKSYHFGLDNATKCAYALNLCNGKKSVQQVAKEAVLSPRELQTLLEDLYKVPLMLEGKKILRTDGYLSGRELFWRLEALLFAWRETPEGKYGFNLDRDIATGKVSENIVKGFCLELGHLLRSVPEELGLAVVHAQSEMVRNLYMQFYNEESKHGQILFKALKSWFKDEEQILFATPLPATVGLMQTYKAWAEKDSLLYATALMRDEASPLDAEVKPEEDIYLGMEKHYNVPSIIIEKYRWHANLDRKNDHGFFPEKIFSLYSVIDKVRARTLVSALKQIIDLHNLFRWNVYAYYKDHSVESRIELYKTFENGSFIYC